MKNRRTDDEWRALFTSREESGLSIVDFCKERKISSGTFYHARKRLMPKKVADTPTSFSRVTLAPKPPTRCLIHTKSGAKLILENPTIEMLRALVGS